MTNCSIPVPCGKCPECMARRVSAWSFRLMQEYKHSSSGHFITLTYDTKYVPITRNGFKTLDKTDFQLFMKRLRKAVSLISDVSLKYYACGEYGGKTSRPHYHMILFNIPDMLLCESAWGLGAVHYGEVTEASVGYTLKYINKPKRIPLHRNDDRLQEFSLMSKGLGASYVNERTIKYHRADIFNRTCLNIEDGKKIAMPRYYKDRIFTESQREQIANHGKSMADEREAAKRARYKGANYDHDVVQSHIAAFKKQDQSSKKRDKL